MKSKDFAIFFIGVIAGWISMLAFVLMLYSSEHKDAGLYEVEESVEVYEVD